MANIIDESIINLDPDKINFEDRDEVKAIFIALLNTVEHLVQENTRLREEVQQLKDENARLKGEKGKPRIKPNVPAREPSLPKPRSKNWSKGSKKDKVKVDREVTVSVECPLPTDARFVGYRKVVIQDVGLKTDNVAYLLERYYSQSLNKYYDAVLPKEVKRSQFGPNLKALTINGLGERAGNAALEEIVMTVRTRPDVFQCHTDLDTTQIVTCSKLVSNITGFPVQPNKAIVGANAFAHESGIHQDGVLKHRETYEIMRAEDVGWMRNRMVLGKHSGRNAFRARLVELGIVFESEEELNSAFARFKDLADKKHEIFDEDLQALVTDSGIEAENEIIRLV